MLISFKMAIFIKYEVMTVMTVPNLRVIFTLIVVLELKIVSEISGKRKKKVFFAKNPTGPNK